ncbi:MAG: glycosyltransferase [Candidatus Wallbacteria bacterium]|nr:glycosyltransferase [Candidatus Wallbacteria bacterium]
MKIGFYSELLEGLEFRTGGAETQIYKTAQHLRKLGCEVRYLNHPAESKECDLIHLFRFSDEVISFFNALPANRPPVVLSTVFWYQEIPLRHLAQDLIDFLSLGFKRAFRRFRGGSTSLKNYQAIRDVLSRVDLLLPNSRAEISNLERFFGKTAEAVVIPNAVDSDLVETTGDESPPGIDFEDFVLSVGRIDDRKNRLNLVRAANLLDLPLVIIGSVSGKKRYRKLYAKIMLEKGRNAEILSAMPQRELCKFYRRARVHALPSWFETPGLASLEAALFGCRLVVTEGGCTREYFGDQAFYCDPGNVDSIAEALRGAWKAQPNSRLKERVSKEFTWEKTARKTLSAYEKVLGIGS